MNSSEAVVGQAEKILEGVYCEHGDHSDDKLPAVGYVHVEMPTDGGTWIIGPGGIKQSRPPNGKKPDEYHMAMCAEHIVPFSESKSLCDCAVPGKWPLQVAEGQHQLLELRKANRNLLFDVAGILFAQTVDSSKESIPNTFKKAKEIVAEVEEHAVVNPGETVYINIARGLTGIPDVAKLAATIFATKTPKSSDRQDVQNAVSLAVQLWLASQVPSF